MRKTIFDCLHDLKVYRFASNLVGISSDVIIWCFLKQKHHFSPFRIFYGLEEGRSLVEVVVSTTFFFLLSSQPLREMIHFDLYSFFKSVGSKYIQTESCPNFASSASQKKQLQLKIQTLRPSRRSSVVLTTSSISCVLDLWEIGYGTLVVWVRLEPQQRPFQKPRGAILGRNHFHGGPLVVPSR